MQQPDEIVLFFSKVVSLHRGEELRCRLIPAWIIILLSLQAQVGSAYFQHNQFKYQQKIYFIIRSWEIQCDLFVSRSERFILSRDSCHPGN